MKFPASATINESSNNPASFQDPKTAPEGQHLSFSSLVEFGKNMPGGFLVYKAYGSEEIIYINDIVLKLFGCKDLEEFKELTHNSFKGMVHEKDLERIETSIYKQVEDDSNNLDYVEYRICRLDGKIRWIDDYGRLVRTIEYGDVFYVLIRDITEEHNNRSQLTDKDHLTKVLNRRNFDKELQRCVNNLMQVGRELALIMIDVDYFKQFNDLYGHYAGDKCLIKVSEAMLGVLKRKTDLLFRYGGEEFAVLLPSVSVEDAKIVAEKLRVAVRNLNLPHNDSPYGVVTISAGIAILHGDDALSISEPAIHLLKNADNGLYDAKKSGRDTIKIAQSNVDKSQ